MNATKLLVLYTRLPGYMLACIEHFCSTQNANALVICYPPSQDAPYRHNTIKQIEIVELGSDNWVSIAQSCVEFEPDVVLVSGWRNSEYMALARKFRKKKKNIICMIDNQWLGTLKQRLGVVVSPFLIKNTFSHMWVPGQRQVEFARRLGFEGDKVISGVYVADTGKFSFTPTDNKRFLFVGRLVKEKCVLQLVETFKEANLPDWRLDIVGSGVLGKKLPSNKKVAVYPFMQPDKLKSFASQGGVFVLPSVFEPWGVVVHEFASAGFPMILSSSIGASDAFLVEGENGFSFEAGETNGLYEAMIKMSKTAPNVRISYGFRSSELAETINHSSWTKALVAIIEKTQS